jgi:hypothetical protein
VDERAQELIGSIKPVSLAPRRDTNQQPDKRCEKRPHEEAHTIGPTRRRTPFKPATHLSEGYKH